MADFLATNEFAGTGGVMQIEVQFAGYKPDDPNAQAPYLSVDDVLAEVLTPVSAGEPELSVPMPLVQINALTFQTSGIVESGKTLRVYRSTEIRWPLVDFINLQVVTERDLDVAIRQVLYAVQESQDVSNRALESAGTIADLAAQAEASAQEAREAADEAIAVSNQAIGDVKRSVRVESTDPEIPTLPSAALRANKVMGFDSLGNPAAIIPASGSAADVLLQLADPAQGANLVAMQDGGNVNDLVEIGVGKGSNRIHFNDGKTLEDLRVLGAGKASEMIPYGAGSVGSTLTELAKLTNPAFGASLIPYNQRTVADRFNDTANVKDYGAIADGTLHPLSERFSTLAAAQAVYPHAIALTDSIDWAAYQAAINAGTPVVYAPGGHYVMNRGTLAARHIRYVGDGYSTRVDFSLCTTVTGCMQTNGTLTALPALSVSIVKGARVVQFASVPDIVPGDVIVAFNPTNGSWLVDRDPYRAGEMWKVHSVAGSVATIYGQSSSVYLSSEVQMYRLRGVKVSAENMHFSPSDTVSVAAFKVVFGDGVRWTGNAISDVTVYTGVEFERCYDVNVNASTTPNRSPAVNDEYGITVSNCHNFVVYGGNSMATRHAIALGGMDDVCCVPNRHGLIFGMILDNVDIPDDIGSGDMHGNTDKVTYDNCVFRNGAIMQGRDVTIQNSTIYGVSSTAGECIYGTEIYGGTFIVKNCRFITYGDAASFGVIHISPGASLREAFVLLVHNNQVELPNATGSSKVVFMRARNSPLPCSASVIGVHVHQAAVALQCFLFADDQVKATLDSNYLIVDDVYGPAGTFLLYPTAKNAAVPTRQMRQSGAVNVNTVAAAVIAAPAQTIRYPYSKMPFAQVTVSSVAGGDQGTVGGATPIALAYNVQTGTIRPAIQAPTGNFTTGGTARLHWQTSLDDI